MCVVLLCVLGPESWFDLTTLKKYPSNIQGYNTSVDSPLEKIPVFIRAGWYFIVANSTASILSVVVIILLLLLYYDFVIYVI